MNDLVDQGLRAVLLFASAGCFRKVAETEGTMQNFFCGQVKASVPFLALTHGITLMCGGCDRRLCNANNLLCEVYVSGYNMESQSALWSLLYSLCSILPK